MDEQDDMFSQAEEWDLEEVEVRKREKSARSIVSVAFSSGDLRKVADAAAIQGLRTSEFIRESAIKESEMVHQKAIVENITYAFGARFFVQQSSETSSSLRLKLDDRETPVFSTAFSATLSPT